VDDDWLLISPEHDHGTLKLLKLVDEAIGFLTVEFTGKASTGRSWGRCRDTAPDDVQQDRLSIGEFDPAQFERHKAKDDASQNPPMLGPVGNAAGAAVSSPEYRTQTTPE